ncbi:MAG: Phosphoglycolate phosphatase [Planctomycetes bacterium]|nr:Phosphoglycolate phosphatase [Planctomycetota bacterium]
MRAPAVLFDLFETLVSVRPAAHERFTWDVLGVRKSDWMRAHFADTAGRALGRVKDPVEAMRLAVHEIDPAIPMDRIEAAALQRVARFDRHLESPAPRVVDAVRRIRSAGVRTGLVSNALHDEVQAWPRSPLAPHFDAAVFSCDVGVAKPDPAIYRHALDRIGVGPEGVLFVGDGGSDEHRGARRAGLVPVIVTAFAADMYPHEIEPRALHADHRFDDVAAFADWLLGGSLSAS